MAAQVTSRAGIAISVSVVALVLALRLWFDIATPPMGDETYYWMWGQHPAWSYLDHPPLDAWLQGLVASLFGWSPISLRLLTWLSLAGILAVLWAWAGEIAAETRAATFWRTTATYLTLPVVALFTMQAFHDHLLVAFSIASLYCFWRFAKRWKAGQGGIPQLYLAAVALGLAVLSKYNGALLGVGLAAVVLLRPHLRSVLKTPHPWLAVMLVIVLQAPVIYWNIADNFASLRFVLLQRHAGHWGDPNFIRGAQFVLSVLFLTGPFLILGLFFTGRSMTVPGERDWRVLTLTVFAVATIIVGIIALNADVLLHWNIVAYVALGLLGAWALRSLWLFVPHVLLTLYILVAAVWNYSVAPISVPGFSDPGTAANYGWPEVASAVQQAQAAHPGAFLAASHYTYASQLGFAIHSTAVTAFNSLISQYDLWWTAADHLGQDAIIVADKTNSIAEAAPHFSSVTRLVDVPVMRGGAQVWTFQVYLGEGYTGAAP